MRALLVVLMLAPSLCWAGSLPNAFESSSPASSGLVRLTAAKGYEILSTSDKARAVSEAADSLGLRNGLFSVELPVDGELWRVKDGKAEKLDRWSDRTLPAGPGMTKTGRWFASFGMQSMSGGDNPSGTMNLRVGSTLFRDRYDLALSYDYSQARDALEGRSSLGLVGRALMPLSAHGGWNIGVELSSVNDFGQKSGSAGVVTGLNVYLPGGSFDISLALRDKGGYGLMAGYTVFLTR